MILEATRCVHSAPALWQSLGSGPILSALNEAGGRDYLTEREVERLIEAARQNRCGHRDATAILVAYRHGLRALEIVALRSGQARFGLARSLRHPSAASF